MNQDTQTHTTLDMRVNTEKEQLTGASQPANAILLLSLIAHKHTPDKVRLGIVIR